MTRLPIFTVVSLALLSTAAFASGPGTKTTKKHYPRRANYSAVDPFAAKDPFATALKAATSTTVPGPTAPAPLSTPNYSNPYLNLNPKPASHSGQPKN